jgi:acyl dehydratase
MPGVLATGMLQAGVLATFLTDWLGPENIRRLKVTFREQARIGDPLEYRAQVIGLREEHGDNLIDLEATVVRAGGGTHIGTSATFVAPTESRTA